MKLFAIVICFCLAIFANAQVVDDFSDGNFNTGPTIWTGDVGEFLVNGSLELQSNGPAMASTLSLITTNNQIDDTEWRFKVKLLFNPSTANFTRIYLASDQTDIEGNLNGYFIQFGETGSSDTLDFYRQDGNSITKIFSGSVSCMPSSTNNDVNVKITRSAIGEWNLFTDCAGGSNYLQEGSVVDATYNSTMAFGFYCRYSTVSRATLFNYDDVYIGNIIADTVAPTLLDYKVVNATSINLYFSEALDVTSAQLQGNYNIDIGIGNPLMATVNAIDNSIVNLTLANALQQENAYNLTAANITDLAGNTLNPNPSSFTFDYYSPKQYDLLINEIFADPTPSVSLPEFEFIEIYNNSNFSIDIENMKLKDNTSNISLPSEIIPTKAYLILCKTGAADSSFSTLGNTLGLSNFPSLTNSGEPLTLRDSMGNLLHFVEYSDVWYNDNLKEDGGWSLELIDPSNPCLQQRNWSASNDVSGGSPGKVNSIIGVVTDNAAPVLIDAFPIGDSSLLLTFNESLDSLNASNPANYFVDQGITGSATSVKVLSPSFKQVEARFSSPFLQNIAYSVAALNQRDCIGNDTSNNQLKFGLPDSIVKGDIVINEILFNPKSGSVDFVELYNASDKILNLSDLLIVRANANAPFVATDQAAISTDGKLLLPDDYVVLTTEPTNIINNYNTPNPEKVIAVSDMPNYPDDEAAVFIRSTKSNVNIDHLVYSEDWHFTLIDDINGVSLERISFLDDTQSESNWHSAAQTVGFATPTYKNSSDFSSVTSEDELVVEPKTFSPDNDGMDDFTTINYNTNDIGKVANITIFDAKGRTIKELAKNLIIAPNSKVKWDGLNEEGTKARIGIYVVFVEVFDLNGNVSTHKKTCVLAGRL